MTERTIRYVDGIGSGAVYGVHCSNVKNLARGLVERVFYVSRNGGLSPPPRPVDGAFGKLQWIKDLLVSNLTPTTVVKLADYPLLYSGRKRVIYQKAVDSLRLRGVRHSDAIVGTFIKAEKINLTAKPDPVPRVIQPNSTRYNACAGCYIKPFEKELYRAFRRSFGYDVVLKGLNATEVAEAMHESWSQFKDPVAVGLDASRFDQHVSVEALKYEHGLYNTVFKSPTLARLLTWQLNSKGIARLEGQIVSYQVSGCRMSGFIGTGIGNCFLMSSMVLGYLQSIGIHARLANNGDDCVVYMERASLTTFSCGIEKWFLELGFTLTVEEPVYDFEKVVFCQSQPVLTSTGWRMVRDPTTAPSKDAVSLLSWSTEAEFRAWCHAIGSCGLELTRGVPFWEQHYRQLLKFGVKREGANVAIRESGLGYMANGVRGGEVSDECRHSFWKAFGMLPEMQLALESRELELTHYQVCGMTKPHVEIQTENSLSRWAKHGRI